MPKERFLTNPDRMAYRVWMKHQSSMRREPEGSDPACCQSKDARCSTCNLNDSAQRVRTWTESEMLRIIWIGIETQPRNQGRESLILNNLPERDEKIKIDMRTHVVMMLQPITASVAMRSKPSVPKKAGFSSEAGWQQYTNRTNTLCTSRGKMGLGKPPPSKGCTSPLNLNTTLARGPHSKRIKMKHMGCST